ncbi:MAG TPA: GNAT family N-acetyltransferase [Phnomibacter sp.]|nr:GNAT family N-acetyltransferase [Phnomibacter sp.]
MINQPIHQNIIRAILPAEAQQLEAFIKSHADGQFTISQGFAYHFAPSIFVSIAPNGSWMGVLVSWQSGRLYNTAVIEGIAVIPAHRGQGIGASLMLHAMHYWRQACVLNLQAMPLQATATARQWYIKEGFVLKQEGSLEYYFKRLLPEEICLQNRKMKPRLNSANGQIDEHTLFEYHQQEHIVWGTYSGGQVQRGVLVGIMNPNKDIQFRYIQLDAQGQFAEGTSNSSTEFLKDGRIVLYENWQWTGNKQGSGTSIIEEIRE